MLKKKDKSIVRAWSMVMQIGISMLSPIILCGVISYFINKSFPADYWFPVWFLLGVIAAFRNVYLLTKSFYGADLKKEEEERKYFEDLKKGHQTHPKDKKKM